MNKTIIYHIYHAGIFPFFHWFVGKDCYLGECLKSIKLKYREIFMWNEYIYFSNNIKFYQNQKWKMKVQLKFGGDMFSYFMFWQIL